MQKYWDKLAAHVLGNVRVYALLLLSLAPFLWFPDSQIIYGPDTVFPIKPHINPFYVFDTWRDSVGFGYGWSDSGLLLQNLFINLLTSVGINYAVIQKIIVTLLIFAGAYGASKLFKILFDEKNFSTEKYAIFAGFLYILNPFALTWVWWRFLGVIYVYAALPYVFIAVLLLVKRQLTLSRSILYALLLSLFAPGIGALAMFFTIALAAMVFVSAHFILNRNVANLLQFFIKGLQFLLLFIGINLYWFLPGIAMLKNSVANALTAYDPLVVFKYTSLNTELLNTFRMLGDHTLTLFFHGLPYYSTALYSVLFAPYYQVLSFIPVFALGLVLLLSNIPYRVKNQFLVLVVLILTALFLMKGNNEPAGYINRSLLSLPFGAIFRIPYDKFGYWIALGYSVLIPAGLMYVRNFRLKRWMTGIVIIYISIPFAVFFTPNFLDEDKGDLKGVLAQVPADYAQIERINLKKTDAILSLPPPYNGESSFSWPIGVQTNSHDVISEYTNARVIYLPNGNAYSDKESTLMNSQIFSGFYKIETIERLLARAGVTHILIHKDWNAGFMQNKVNTPAYYISYIAKLKNTEVVLDNDYFTIYSLHNQNTRAFQTAGVVTSEKASVTDVPRFVSFFPNFFITDRYSNKSEFSYYPLKIKPELKPGALEYVFESGSENTLQLASSTVIANAVGLPITIDVISDLASSSDFKVKLDPQNIATGTHTISVSGFGTSTATYFASEFDDVEEQKSADWECGQKFKNEIIQNSAGPDEFLTIKSTDAGAACHMLNLTVATTGNALISIKYKTEQPVATRLLILSSISRAQTDIVINRELDPVRDWTTAYFEFPVTADRQYRMFLYSSISDDQVNTSDFDKLQLTVVPRGFNELVALTNLDARSSLAASTSPVNVVLDNSGYIKVYQGIDPNKLFILNSAYDTRWRAYFYPGEHHLNIFERFLGPSSKYLIEDQNHILIDGYANGWNLSNQGLTAPGTLVVFYSLQKIQNISILISILVLFFSFSYLHFAYRRGLIWERPTTELNAEERVLDGPIVSYTKTPNRFADILDVIYFVGQWVYVMWRRLVRRPARMIAPILTLLVIGYMFGATAGLFGAVLIFMLFYHIDSRLLLIIGLILLSISFALYILNIEKDLLVASKAANYAYIFLAMATILQFAEYKRSLNRITRIIKQGTNLPPYISTND